MLDSGAMVVYFPCPRSATGEDMLEFHVHGGPAIIKAVLAAISQCSTTTRAIRYAEAGEFTRRAFFNGKMDLRQAEALGDSLSAMTEQQRRLSVRGTTSRIGQGYESWRGLLLSARGELEALIDFSEDQHFDESPAELISNVSQQVMALQASLSAHISNAVKGELLRNGIGVSLLGAPNAGKSSLLNRIVGREAAIVSPEAGTTRDIVEVAVDIGGYLCRFGDTAGLRRALCIAGVEIGDVEQEGIRRAKARAAESDLVVVLMSIEIGNEAGPQLNLDAEVVQTAQSIVRSSGNILVAVNKIDQKPDTLSTDKIRQLIQAAIPQLPASSIYLMACSTPSGTSTSFNPEHDGIAPFIGGLVKKFDEMTTAVAVEGGAFEMADPSVWQESLGATERQRLLLEECSAHLDTFLELTGHETTVDVFGHRSEDDSEQKSSDRVNAARHGVDEVDFVLAAEQLRAAAVCLSRITGRGEAGDVEEVLGVVFERFCVGK
ncbi:tRNA modification GTPase GTPBP3, mitochondrial [Sphaceloma murrayae]|uniref:tRNA modification GTPase GTPBP3, mitochondrial n=1 Tax=Sphaceloma murrayae TaxID=2082308 RepID=A0A2K1QHM0_9PEZI|nr:tRNA modification GTPase GTPBP3, mitochondrial [Sphaceloma murrayae]